MGEGFDESNLHYMRQFYRAFPIWNAVRSELSWTHYRILSRVENPLPAPRIWKCRKRNVDLQSTIEYPSYFA
jgi:hypothetical protein